MQIRELRVKNFRALRDIVLHLDDTTVLLGENNTGKSAALDAVRMALSGVVNRRSTPFVEYDFHAADDAADPRTSAPIEIEATFGESKQGEWPAAVLQGLEDVVQFDPAGAINSIRFRLTYAWDSPSRSYVAKVDFLNLHGDVLLGKASVHNALLRYVPLFRLSALRDATNEFGSRSQFWGRLLRSLEIPEDKLVEVMANVDRLNNELMTIDPRVDKIKATVGKVGDVVPAGDGDRVAVRALPLKVWDLMSRSEIVYRGKGTTAPFPLDRHGQGVQSLAVLFLFQAFVEQLLDQIFEHEARPVLTLEEPEAHLHPQAARLLWRKLDELPGQKVVTTHSPYFLQHVPLRKLRIMRREGSSVAVHWIRSFVEAKVPATDALLKLPAKLPETFDYLDASETVRAKARIDEASWKKLVSAAGATTGPIVEALKALRVAAASLLSESEVAEVTRYVQRTRGEILFSRAWLLCEGIADAIVLECFAECCGLILDREGIAIINYQENGSPGAFAAAARALGFPWLLVADNDGGGANHIAALENRGFSPEDIAARGFRLPDSDIEGFLSKKLTDDMIAVATELGAKFENAVGSSALVDEELPDFLRSRKADAAFALAARLRGAGPERVPEFFRDVLDKAKEEANG